MNGNSEEKRRIQFNMEKETEKYKMQEKFTQFFRTHKEIFTILGILVICLILYCFAMGSYPLIDPYETKLVSIARSMYRTGELFALYLNGTFYFEIPPLYFWLETIAFSIFGKACEVTARIPVAVYASAGVFLVYSLCRKLISRKLAIASSLILATSIMYILFAKIAVAEMLFAFCTGVSVYSCIYTLFCKDSQKKYFWWLFYIFTAFALMTKGLPGILIPLVTSVLCYGFSKKLLEILKPVNIIPGLIFFTIITLPWHLIMMTYYNPQFFENYVLKNHIDKYWYLYSTSHPAPWYFIAAAFFAAFFPWIFSFIAQILVFFKEKSLHLGKYCFDFKSLNFPQKFIFCNVIYFLTIIILFSLSAAKLPWYALPAIIPASVILGKFWTDYFEEDKHNIAINITMIILTILCFLGIAGIFIIPEFFKGEAKLEITGVRPEILLLLLVVVTMQIFSYIKNAKKVMFSSIIILMTGASMIMSAGFFDFVCAFGENDIIKYTTEAKQDKTPIVTYGLNNEASVFFYYEQEYVSYKKGQVEDMAIYAESYPDTRFIVKNSDLKALSKDINFEIKEKGVKYALIEKIKQKKD